MSEQSEEPGQTITLPGGRRLGYLVVGEGKPVFCFHGFPGSRLEVLFFREMAISRHLQMIGIDRPGYGLSGYAKREGFADSAADVSLLANHLGIDRFQTLGWSGGGHYAVIAAAALGHRVSRAVVIAGMSLPPDTSEMSPMFKIAYALATLPVLGKLIVNTDRNTFLKMAKDIDAYLNSKAGRRYLTDNRSADDAKFLSSPSERRELLMRVYADACRQPESVGVKAAVEEVRFMKRGWGINLSQIPSGLVHIWHGKADKSAAVSNAHRLAQAVPGAHLKLFDGEGHLFILNHLQELGELVSS